MSSPSVLNFGDGRGLALTTDGVGTKILVAEMAGRFDTIGIDCIAMNVNDLVCVGAEPLAMRAGAELANICIPGGEVSQMPEVVAGINEGDGIDLVGTAVGSVDLDKRVLGEGIENGDVLVGLASNGIHSNGLTLARRVLFHEMGLVNCTTDPHL